MSQQLEHPPTRQRRKPTTCTICDAPAIYSYLGVIVCASCKMFFKRHALADQSHWRCQTGGKCRVSFKERPMCFPCRMKECLDHGMSADLFRGTTAKNRNRKKVVMIRPPNLLERDQSTLTSAQWAHLSSIIHCYDEYGQYSCVESYMKEQQRLPIKLRYRPASILDLVFKVAAGGQILFEKNGDFLALPKADRYELLRSSIRTVTGFNSALIGYKAKVFEISACRDTIYLMYGHGGPDSCYIAGARIDPDMVFFKLILSALMFSTFAYTHYSPDLPIIPNHVPKAIRIHDSYIELAWRYMTYTYGLERAIRSFSNLVLSLLALHQALTQVAHIKEYSRMIDDLVRETARMISRQE